MASGSFYQATNCQIKSDILLFGYQVLSLSIILPFSQRSITTPTSVSRVFSELSRNPGSFLQVSVGRYEHGRSNSTSSLLIRNLLRDHPLQVTTHQSHFVLEPWTRGRVQPTEGGSVGNMDWKWRSSWQIQNPRHPPTLPWSVAPPPRTHVAPSPQTPPPGRDPGSNSLTSPPDSPWRTPLLLNQAPKKIWAPNRPLLFVAARPRPVLVP